MPPGLSETRALAILSEELPSAGRHVRVGIGDDAAVLAPPSGKQVWTVDACVEGVHFRRNWLSPADLAHKSLHAAVSDLAAMGAKPTAALVQIAYPTWLTPAFFRLLTREQAQVSSDLGCPIVGGNLTRGGELAIVTTALGTLSGGPLLRSGARAGDELWLVGELGWARLGLIALERGLGRSRVFSRAIEAFRRPRARISEGLRLAARAHACLDVSDGLLRDAPRLGEASRVKVVIERARLERATDEEFSTAARELGVDPLQALLAGGEDYALLAAGPARVRPRFVRAIGRIESGHGAWLEDGQRLRALRGGFQH